MSQQCPSISQPVPSASIISWKSWSFSASVESTNEPYSKPFHHLNAISRSYVFTLHNPYAFSTGAYAGDYGQHNLTRWSLLQKNDTRLQRELTHTYVARQIYPDVLLLSGHLFESITCHGLRSQRMTKL